MLILPTILGLILYIAIARVWMNRKESSTKSSVAYLVSTLLIIFVMSMFSIKGDLFLAIVFYLLALRDLMIVLYLKRGNNRTHKLDNS